MTTSNARAVQTAAPHRGPHADARRASRVRGFGLAAVLLSTLGLGIAYGVGFTITTVQFEGWGEPGWLVGLASAAPGVAVLLLASVAPRIAVRVGTVPAMVGGAVIAAASFALMPVLDSAGWWVLLRFASGIGLTLPWLISETWINTVSTDAVRGRVLAAYTVLLFGGWAGAPLLLERLGTDGAIPFALGIGGMVLLAAPLLAAHRLAPSLRDPGRFALRRVIALAPLGMAAALAGGVVEFGYISLLPVYAIEAGASTSTALHLLSVLLIGGITLQFLIGWLADRVDRTALLGTLGVLLTVVCTLLAVLVDVDGAAFVAVFLLGGVVMAFYALGLTLLGEQVPAHQLVLGNAGFLIAYAAGGVAGPLVGGAAMDVWEPHGLAVVVVVAGLALAGYAWRTHRTRRTAVSSGVR